MGCLGVSARGLAGGPGTYPAFGSEDRPRPAGDKAWNDPRALSGRPGHLRLSLCSPDRENRRHFGGGHGVVVYMLI